LYVIVWWFCLVLGLTLIVKCTNSTSCISFGFALLDRKTDNDDGKSFLIKLCTYIYYIFYWWRDESIKLYPSQGHYDFHSFPVVEWFCLFIYLWVLTFPLLDCSEFGNFVITLICEVNVKNTFTSHIDKNIFLKFLFKPYLYTFSLYENSSFIIFSAETEYISTKWFLRNKIVAIIFNRYPARYNWNSCLRTTILMTDHL
jgi:hypothetical protein